MQQMAEDFVHLASTALLAAQLGAQPRSAEPPDTAAGSASQPEVQSSEQPQALPAEQPELAVAAGASAVAAGVAVLEQIHFEVSIERLYFCAFLFVHRFHVASILLSPNTPSISTPSICPFPFYLIFICIFLSFTPLPSPPRPVVRRLDVRLSLLPRLRRSSRTSSTCASLAGRRGRSKLLRRCCRCGRRTRRRCPSHWCSRRWSLIAAPLPTWTMSFRRCRLAALPPGPTLPALLPVLLHLPRTRVIRTATRSAGSRRERCTWSSSAFSVSRPALGKHKV